MIPAQEPSRPWSALDGYRAYAILVVMLVHARHSVGYPEWMAPADPFIRGGVTAFMVLSGYLITRSLLGAESRMGSLTIRSFLATQAVRFYVPVVGYLAVVCSIWGWQSTFGWRDSLRVLWMDPHTWEGTLLTRHLYSLAAQMQFCLGWPWVLRLLPRARRCWPVALLACLAVVWRGVAPRFAAPADPPLVRTDYVFASLLIGAWWAVADVEGKLDWIKGISRRTVVLLTMAAVLVLAFTRSPSAFLGLFSQDLRELVAPWRELPAVAFTIRLLGAFFARLAFGLLVFLLHQQRPYRLARVLAWPGIAWLGRISFSVYLWQNVFCFGLTGTVFDRFPLNLVASVACGAAAYWLIEKPSLRWRSRVKRRFLTIGPSEACVPGLAQAEPGGVAKSSGTPAEGSGDASGVVC